MLGVDLEWIIYVKAVTLNILHTRTVIAIVHKLKETTGVNNGLYVQELDNIWCGNMCSWFNTDNDTFNLSYVMDPSSFRKAI